MFTEYCNITLKVSGVSFREVLLLIRKSILNTDGHVDVLWLIPHWEKVCHDGLDDNCGLKVNNSCEMTVECTMEIPIQNGFL